MATEATVEANIDVTDSPGTLSNGRYVITVEAIDAAGASVVNGVTLVARVD